MTITIINGIPFPTEPGRPKPLVRVYWDDEGTRFEVHAKMHNELLWDVGVYRMQMKKGLTVGRKSVVGWYLTAKGETAEEMCEKGWRRYRESRSATRKEER